MSVTQPLEVTYRCDKCKRVLVIHRIPAALDARRNSLESVALCPDCNPPERHYGVLTKGDVSEALYAVWAKQQGFDPEQEPMDEEDREHYAHWSEFVLRLLEEWDYLSHIQWPAKNEMSSGHTTIYGLKPREWLLSLVGS